MVNNEIKNSLLLNVTIYLIIIVIVIQVFSSTFIIFQKTKNDYETYKNNKEEITNELSKRIIYYLWNYSLEEAKDICIIKFNNNKKDFVGITIYDKNTNRLIFGFEQNDSKISAVDRIDDKSYDKIKVELKYNNTAYWYANFYFSNVYLYEELKKNIINTSITTLLLIISISLSLIFILNRLLIKPINDLIDNSIKITNGNYSLIIPDSDIKEIDLLSQNYKIMSKAIKKRENDLQTLIREKDLLIQEIHHRVKNNMFFLYSIFDLQKEYTKEIKVKNFIEDAKNRVKSIGLVHRMIYKSDNMVLINFSKFIKTFCNELIETFSYKSKKIDVTYRLNTVNLNINQATICGIIINELITNSIKHAFKNLDSGKIWIELSKKNDNITLLVGNNGKELSKNFDITKIKSLGLGLVLMLARQLKADLRIEKNRGTVFILNFKQGK